MRLEHERRTQLSRSMNGWKLNDSRTLHTCHGMRSVNERVKIAEKVKNTSNRKVVLFYPFAIACRDVAHTSNTPQKALQHAKGLCFAETQTKLLSIYEYVFVHNRKENTPDRKMGARLADAPQ